MALNHLVVARSDIPFENLKMDFRIYVRAIVINDDGELLMLRKTSSQKIAPGLWLLPGGTLEFGETALVSVRRELKEEVGLTVTAAQLIGQDMRVIGSTHWQGLIFLIKGDTSVISNLEPDKHELIEWKDQGFAKSVLSANEWAAFVSAKQF